MTRMRAISSGWIAAPARLARATTSSLRLDPQRRRVEVVNVLDWEAKFVGELCGGVIIAGLQFSESSGQLGRRSFEI